jgi:hypothetical protein
LRAASAWTALALALAACAGPALRTRALKPTLRGDRQLIDVAAIREFASGGSGWTARYAQKDAERALFCTCAEPRDSLYTVAVTFPNSAIYLDETGRQVSFMVTPTKADRLMWTSEDGRVLGSIDRSGATETTQDVRLQLWNGGKLAALNGFPKGDLFLGSREGFVLLEPRLPSDPAMRDAGARDAVLTFHDYKGRALGKASLPGPVVDRSWRASHSPEGRHVAFAAQRAAAGAPDSLHFYDTVRAVRLWSASFRGIPERVRVGPRGERVVLVTALDDSTRRIALHDGKGRLLAGHEVRGGAAEDVVFSCSGGFAFACGRGFRVLLRARTGEAVYTIAEPEVRVTKASLSDGGEVFAVTCCAPSDDKPVETVLYGPDGQRFWSTPSGASIPGTDAWISPRGDLLFVRAHNVLEIYR